MKTKKIHIFLTLFFTICASNIFAQTQDLTTQQPSLVIKLAVLAGVALLPFAVMLLTSFVK